MLTAPIQALTRFGLGGGPTAVPPADPRAWLAAQLDGPDLALATPRFQALPNGASALAALRADIAARRRVLAAGEPLKGHFKSRSLALFVADARAALDWAVITPAPFRERLVWFWANHFTVSIRQGGTFGLVGPFVREAIRPHVTGRFTDMVLAAERHPAMLLYLSNAGSVGPQSPVGRRTGRGLNENLGRECLELHTVGLAARYTQADVTSMAKLLTGWSISAKHPPEGFLFRPRAHEPGPQTVLGRTFPPGEEGGLAALRFLSTYPTTWASLAQKLVRHFVTDNPPPHAVQRITAVLAETDGDLRATALALIDLPEAWQPLTKLKTPLEYMVSVLRATPPSTRGTTPYFAILRKLGQPLWAAPLPNGWSDIAADWAASDAVLGRISFGFSHASRIPEADPLELADAALGPVLRPETATAIRHAGSRVEAVSLLFAAPEFQRR
jgi:uncharacterized protein (DUF1800 family)